MFIIPSGVFANVYILSKDIYKAREKNKYRINTTSYFGNGYSDKVCRFGVAIRWFG